MQRCCKALLHSHTCWTNFVAVSCKLIEGRLVTGSSFTDFFPLFALAALDDFVLTGALAAGLSAVLELVLAAESAALLL